MKNKLNNGQYSACLGLCLWPLEAIGSVFLWGHWDLVMSGKTSSSTTSSSSVYYMFICTELSSVSESIFLFLFWITGCKLRAAANHWHGRYQNNMAAQQIGAPPSVLITPTSANTISPGLWRHICQMET